MIHWFVLVQIINIIQTDFYNTPILSGVPYFAKLKEEKEQRPIISYLELKITFSLSTYFFNTKNKNIISKPKDFQQQKRQDFYHIYIFLFTYTLVLEVEVFWKSAILDYRSRFKIAADWDEFRSSWISNRSRMNFSTKHFLGTENES